MDPTIIAANKRYAERLGWSPSDFEAEGFDTELIRRIKLVQNELSVKVDGYAGPKTYAEWLRREITRRAVSPQTIKTAGQVVAYQAKLIWLQVVIDSEVSPPSLRIIDDMIRTSRGLHWGWEPEYRKNGQFKWCGAFAARCWSTVGMSAYIRKGFFSSTVRLDRWARGLNFEQWINHPVAPPPMLIELGAISKPGDAVFSDGSRPRAGDLVLIGDAQHARYGTHIAVCEAFDPATNVITTIEGNAYGMLPDGSIAEGVVRQRRMIGRTSNTPYFVRLVIRPSPKNLDELSA